MYPRARPEKRPHEYGVRGGGARASPFTHYSLFRELYPFFNILADRINKPPDNVGFTRTAVNKPQASPPPLAPWCHYHYATCAPVSSCSPPTSLPRASASPRPHRTRVCPPLSLPSPMRVCTPPSLPRASRQAGAEVYIYQGSVSLLKHICSTYFAHRASCLPLACKSFCVDAPE